MESSPQRRCPRCGMAVARKADSCLMCGAVLKEKKTRDIRLPIGDLLLPLLLVVVIAAVWVWKPWQARLAGELAAGLASPTAAASPVPTETYTPVPTATPLDTPIPSPTPTLPPDSTMHTVVSGETISTIAKAYGTTVAAVLKANNLKGTSIIKPGAKLVIPLPKALLPTATPTPLPSPTALTYVVKSGDTLSDIATKFNTTAAALMKANTISDPTRIHVGARLRIVRPDELPVEPTVAPTKTYVVKEGDTLYDIATKFKVTVANLKSANGLKSNMLRIGQKLTIPGGPAGAAPVPTATPQVVAQPVEATTAPVAPVTTTNTLSETLLTDPRTSTISAAMLPTWTPVPEKEEAAANLLAPANGASFERQDAAIRLIWASVGILDDDEWYVVRLRRGDGDEKDVSLYWTKATSFRVPASLYVPDATQAQRWRWRVLVMRHTGKDEEGNWLGEEIRPASLTRVFYWK